MSLIQTTWWKKLNLTCVSELSQQSRRCSGKTQLGVSVVFPLQVHALHSPPLTLSLPLSLLSLRMQACIQLWHKQTPSSRRTVEGGPYTERGRLVVWFFPVVWAEGRFGPAFILWCRVKFGKKRQTPPNIRFHHRWKTKPWIRLAESQQQWWRLSRLKSI